jgi:hypothetical protein
LAPLAMEFKNLNTKEIVTQGVRTAAIEKRYAQLANIISNEFVDIMGKHIEQQLGKKITSSKPKLSATKDVNKIKPEGLPEIDNNNKNTCG